MKTKQEILNYLNLMKGKYEENIIRYDEILNNLDLKSNDYKMFDLMKKKDKEHLYQINNLLDFINEKEDK